MESNFKTIFVHSTIAKGKSIFSFKSTINGDQFARDVQATIDEMKGKGFELYQMSPIYATTTILQTPMQTTEGMLMVFKKV